MRLRMIVTLTVGALIALLTATPALAGGWAVTTMDSVPEDLEAGVTYEIGYTVLQHGEKPVDGMATGIVILPGSGGSTIEYSTGSTIIEPSNGSKPIVFNPNGGDAFLSQTGDGPQALFFEGEPSGAPGHYVAQVTVPESGQWELFVSQDYFGLASLGTLSVAEGSGGLMFGTVLEVALPVLAIVAVALFAIQLMVLLRGRRTMPQPEPATGWQRPVVGD